MGMSGGDGGESVANGWIGAADWIETGCMATGEGVRGEATAALSESMVVKVVRVEVEGDGVD